MTPISLVADAFIDTSEQGARHIDDEVGAQCVIERGLAKVAARVRYALAELSATSRAVRSSGRIAHYLFSLEDFDKITR